MILLRRATLPNQTLKDVTVLNHRLTDVLEQLAGDKLATGAKEQLLKFSSHMDQIALLDPRTQDIHIDEQMFQKTLEETIPGPFAATFLQQMRNDLKSRLTTSAKAHGVKPIPWLDFATQQGLEPAHDTAAIVTQLTTTTTADSSAVLRQILPGISDAALQPGALEARIRQLISSQAQTTSGPVALSLHAPNWNAVGVCCQNRLGWWFWPTVAWVVVCFVVTLPNLLLGAALAAASVGLGTATIILNCIIAVG
jgi:hypothetical protein